MFLFSKEQGIPDQKQNQKTEKMTDKESDSLNLHNFLPTKGKTPRLPVVPTFVASKAHSKDKHPLLLCTYHPKQVRESFALRGTILVYKAIKQSTRNDLSEKRNSVLLNALQTKFVQSKTIASSSTTTTFGRQAISKFSSEKRKQDKQVLDNVKTKQVLKPVRSCWVENRNKNGKPFNSHLGKQPPFSTNKLVEKNQRSAYGNKQFKKNIFLGIPNKLVTSRTQIKTPRDFDKAKTGVIYLYYTSNNTVCTLVDLKGVTKGWSSCGSLGFKSARKSTAYASQATTERIGLKAKELGFKWAFIVLKGVGRGKESGVRAFRKSGIEILGILEKTGIPHNGCRAPRKRRI